MLPANSPKAAPSAPKAPTIQDANTRLMPRSSCNKRHRDRRLADLEAADHAGRDKGGDGRPACGVGGVLLGHYKAVLSHGMATLKWILIVAAAGY